MKRRRRTDDGMQVYDRLPAELRVWLASAVLPWGPRSVQRTYAKALARTQNPDDALEELDQIQKRMIAKDARKVWGEDHPDALQETVV